MEISNNEFVMQHLKYFVKWGGPAWRKLFFLGVQNIGFDLTGKNVLEIGMADGRMACFFALLGGNVVGVDIKKEYIGIAEQEAQKWGVLSKVKFLQYDGNLDILPYANFDLVFTKSVLITIPNLECFLSVIHKKLKPGGICFFLENTHGNCFTHNLRRFRYRNKRYKRINFFTPQTINLINNLFNILLIKQSIFPPCRFNCGEEGIRHKIGLRGWGPLFIDASYAFMHLEGFWEKIRNNV